MHFAIVNESTNSSLTSTLVEQIANAIQEQTATDFSLDWETLGAVVEVLDMSQVPPTCDTIVHFVDTIPEAPDALAYHTIDNNGVPVARLGVNTILSNGGTINTGAESVSCAASHEILETIEDEYCSQWNDWDGTKKVAYEVCDPVQDESYEINGIAVSNYVTREWFDIDAGQSGIFDKLGSLTKSRSITAGGYVAFDDGTQQFGSAMSEAKKAQKSKYGRRAKRG